MGINATMEIGKNGLNVFRSATAVVSQNIANVSTPGYSRQKAIIETSPVSMLAGFTLGTGAMITSVDRFYDGLLQQQMASSETTLGYDSTKSTVLQQIEPAFNEISTAGTGAAISNFFVAWQDLTNNPGGTAERQSVLSNAQILADEFHSTSKTLSDTVSLQNSSLVPVIDSINATIKDIAKLNAQVSSTDLVAGNANEVKDKRDLLVRQLAKQIGITSTENSDGTTDIKLADGGGALVTGGAFGTLSLNKTNPNSFVVQLTPAGGAPPPVTVTPTTGSLGATLALRDSILPGYQAQLDSLATTLAAEVNKQHMAGFDLNGNLGIALFDPAATTAATFGINPAMNSTTLIAASSNTSAAGDNINAVTIAGLQSQRLMSGNTLTFNGFWNGLVSQVGLNVSSSKTNVTQDEAFSNQLHILRDTNSGVSLDQELSDLMMYQRSYQACAQVITTATSMMDTVLGIIR
ncbi:MAG TPA: flagellar hook-associated protein FlgK [Desulfuromonadales bacterium]|nr:flagellar hook-associated protein FlgK [Desulfuromonadales bacterium]